MTKSLKTSSKADQTSDVTWFGVGFCLSFPYSCSDGGGRDVMDQELKKRGMRRGSRGVVRRSLWRGVS